MVGYAEGLLADGQVVMIGRTGSDFKYQIKAISIQETDGSVVRAELFNGKELFLAPGQLAWILSDGR